MPQRPTLVLVYDLVGTAIFYYVTGRFWGLSSVATPSGSSCRFSKTMRPIEEMKAWDGYVQKP